VTLTQPFLAKRLVASLQHILSNLLHVAGQVAASCLLGEISNCLGTHQSMRVRAVSAGVESLLRDLAAAVHHFLSYVTGGLPCLSRHSAKSSLLSVGLWHERTEQRTDGQADRAQQHRIVGYRGKQVATHLLSRLSALRQLITGVLGGAAQLVRRVACPVPQIVRDLVDTLLGCRQGILDAFAKGFVSVLPERVNDFDTSGFGI
jgi:hypothetical protein